MPRSLVAAAGLTAGALEGTSDALDERQRK